MQNPGWNLVGMSFFKDASTIYLVAQVHIAELRNSNRLTSQTFKRLIRLSCYRSTPRRRESANPGTAASGPLRCRRYCSGGTDLTPEGLAGIQEGPRYVSVIYVS